ncbi:MAG: hypothetical protein M1822_008770 [Bathelium mastoideum]|nr:MAG: hypothetical protein M1822_008770 [Bathelium mastoideum]
MFKKFAKALGRVPRVEKRQTQICVEDVYYQVLINNTAAGPFCSTLIGAPTQTIETDYTPIVTATTITSTSTITISERVHVTPIATITTTVISSAARMKRQAPSTTTSMSLADEIQSIQLFIRQVDNNSTAIIDNSTILASMSSACSCLGVPATTTISTYTEATSTAYLIAWEDSTETVSYTTTEPTAFTTTTYTQAVDTSLTVSSSGAPGSTYSSASSSASSTASATSTYFSTQSPASTIPAPIGIATAVNFSCPEYNNSQGYIIEGSKQYVFNIYCDIAIDEPASYPVPSSVASTATQCAAACAEADSQLDNIVCKGINFNSDSTSGSVCSLVASSQSLSYSFGSFAATLQIAAQGFSGNSTSGPAFQGLGLTNASSTDISSSLASLLSASPPIVTTPPISTAYRNGSVISTAYSSGTFFYTESGTTYSNGSWFDSFSEYSYSTFYAATITSTLYSESAISTLVGGNGISASGAPSLPGSYSTISNSTSVTAETVGNSIEEIITTTITNTTYFANGTSTNTSYTYSTVLNGTTSGGANIISGGISSSLTTSETSYSSTTATTLYGPTYTSTLSPNLSDWIRHWSSLRWGTNSVSEFQYLYCRNRNKFRYELGHSFHHFRRTNCFSIYELFCSGNID